MYLRYLLISKPDEPPFSVHLRYIISSMMGVGEGSIIVHEQNTSKAEFDQPLCLQGLVWPQLWYHSCSRLTTMSSSPGRFTTSSTASSRCFRGLPAITTGILPTVGMALPLKTTLIQRQIPLIWGLQRSPMGLFLLQRISISRL